MAVRCGRDPETGYTLIEMLAVIAIIAIVAGGAMLTVSGGASRQLRQEAERLDQTLQMAADEAVFQGTEMGAYFTTSGYGFLRYDTTAQGWRELDGNAFGAHLLPAELRLALTLGRTPLELPSGATHGAAHPAVLFLSSGETTAFSLSLSSRGDNRRIMIGTDGMTPITLREGGEQ